jgi:mono/diheme cytochrome c family protein
MEGVSPESRNCARDSDSEVPEATHRPLARFLILGVTLILLSIFLLLTAGCEQSSNKLGRPLNETELRGKRLFISNCKKCHQADSGLATQGPNLEGVFDKKFLPSGAPANDERVKNLLQYGRRSMPAFGQVLDDSQMDAIIAYLKTQ